MPDRRGPAPVTAPAPEAVVLVNARSRRGAALHGRIAPALEARGVRVRDVHVVRDPGAQLPDLLPRVLADEPPVLVVGSGDGTLAAVVDHLAGRRTVLGYLPLGTTNNTGRSLGLPLRHGAALDVVAHGRTVSVDLGRANDDRFANLVSVGLSSEVAGRTPHLLKRRLGRVAYAVTAARALATHRPFEAEVTVDGRTWHVRTHQLNVANGRVHAGTPIAADAGIDDRLLVAYALGGGAPGVRRGGRGAPGDDPLAAAGAQGVRHGRSRAGRDGPAAAARRRRRAGRLGGSGRAARRAGRRRSAASAGAAAVRPARPARARALSAAVRAPTLRCGLRGSGDVLRGRATVPGRCRCGALVDVTPGNDLSSRP